MSDLNMKVCIIHLNDGNQKWFVMSNGTRSMVGSTHDSADILTRAWTSRYGKPAVVIRHKGYVAPADAIATIRRILADNP